MTLLIKHINKRFSGINIPSERKRNSSQRPSLLFIIPFNTKKRPSGAFESVHPKSSEPSKRHHKSPHSELFWSKYGMKKQTSQSIVFPSWFQGIIMISKRSWSTWYSRWWPRLLIASLMLRVSLALTFWSTTLIDADRGFISYSWFSQQTCELKKKTSWNGVFAGRHRQWFPSPREEESRHCLSNRKNLSHAWWGINWQTKLNFWD
jgi:hypothetical protein